MPLQKSDHGFHHFMSNKDFHPASIWNIKKVWEARQKVAADEKRQKELRHEYDQEQEMRNNKVMLGDEKSKMSLSFIYDPPPGITKEKQLFKTIKPASSKLINCKLYQTINKQSGWIDKERIVENEPKFEWQRNFPEGKGPPRSLIALGDDQVFDKPFAIEVKNVKCRKCGKWGHVHTDNDCPLYNKMGSIADPISTNPSDLIRNHKRKMAEAAKAEASPAKSSSFLMEKSKSTGDPKKLTVNFQVNPWELAFDMQKEHKITLKSHVMDSVITDLKVEKIGSKKSSNIQTKTAEVKSELEAATDKLNLLKAENLLLTEAHCAIIVKKAMKYLEKKEKKRSKNLHKKEFAAQSESGGGELWRSAKSADQRYDSRKVKQEPCDIPSTSRHFDYSGSFYDSATSKRKETWSPEFSRSFADSASSSHVRPKKLRSAVTPRSDLIINEIATLTESNPSIWNVKSEIESSESEPKYDASIASAGYEIGSLGYERRKTMEKPLSDLIIDELAILAESNPNNLKVKSEVKSDSEEESEENESSIGDSDASDEDEGRKPPSDQLHQDLNCCYQSDSESDSEETPKVTALSDQIIDDLFASLYCSR